MKSLQYISLSPNAVISWLLGALTKRNRNKIRPGYPVPWVERGLTW